MNKEKEEKQEHNKQKQEILQILTELQIQTKTDKKDIKQQLAKLTQNEEKK